MVYASGSLALCLAECLVHLPGRLPEDYVATKLELDDRDLEELDVAGLKQKWREDLGYTRAIGDQWLNGKRSVALAVPSVVLPESTNILINPLHPRADRVRIVNTEPFRFDPRLGR